VGVKQDKKKALEWYTKSAAQGFRLLSAFCVKNVTADEAEVEIRVQQAHQADQAMTLLLAEEEEEYEHEESNAKKQLKKKKSNKKKRKRTKKPKWPLKTSRSGKSGPRKSH
jgi:TPR repeat protein